MKVYGWTDMLYDKKLRAELQMPEHRVQVRGIVAARSQAAAARAAGYKRPSQMFNLCETGNADEIQQAMQAGEGIVLVAVLDGPRRFTFLQARPDAPTQET